MKGVLYIPHTIYDDERAFNRFVKEEKQDYSLNFKLNMNESGTFDGLDEIEKLIWNETASKDSINEEKFQKLDSKLINNFKTSFDSEIDKDFLSKSKTMDSLEKQVFSPMPVTIYNVNGAPENIKNLIAYYRNGIDFPMLIVIDMDNTHPDAETQFKTWVSLTKKLYTLPKHRMSDEMKIKKSPTKTFKLYLGPQANAYLDGCKLIEKMSIDKYIIYVNKITFYNT